MRIPMRISWLIALAAARIVSAEPVSDMSVVRLGEGMRVKSDGLFIFQSGGTAGHFLVEQAWDGDARLWRFINGVWKSERLYKGLGQCFSPLVYDFDGDGAYSVFIGSWEKAAGVHEIPLQKDGRPSGIIRILPGSDACGKILCLRVGDGRGDGLARLYVGSEENGGGLHEFTWKQGIGWTRIRIHTGHVGEFAIGDGRGDGVRRIYAGDRDGQLYEFTWRKNHWQKQDVPLPAKNVRTVALGDGRGDSKPRLYVNAGSGSFEVEYGDGQWHARRIGRDGARYYFAIGRTAGEKPGVYSPVQGVGLFEWRWRNGAYSETQVDAVTSATGQVAVGDGRGDGIQRLYVTNGDRQESGAAIWELTIP